MARLTDGHSTTISFAAAPSVLFYEVEVTPPGASGGGENDTTTMLNTAWRTRQPKKLKTLTECSFTASYDPAVLDDVIALMNVNNQITVTFPDSSTWVFYGWLDEFTPGANTEGSQPTAEGRIVPSNQNSSGTETAPVYAA